MTSVHLLCAGAVRGLVQALEPAFCADTGAALQARFGAVGAMKEALLGGEPCDAVVLTQTMVDALVADGHLLAQGRSAIGRVLTGIAVPEPGPHPGDDGGASTTDPGTDVSTPAALQAVLRAASAIYFPDAVRSTAGIHFAGVMRSLGILDELQPRLKTYPNGATAMREMAASGDARAIGCTQVTEILYTPGVRLVAPLPLRFELSTVYTAALASRAQAPALAARLIALLAGSSAAAWRTAGGFSP